MWGISELSFRFELLILDRHLDSLVREGLVLRCFFRPNQPRRLATVSVRNARLGLASPDVRDRLPYLHALCRVMFEWDNYHRHHVARLPSPTAEAPENELLHYEYPC
ncbi:hypothetical protein F5887DRAFT_1028526 [Amanita rubescens]|nr:hypothetical protein F5887DRAFT_1028526 [Amanita rubescens]